MTNKTVHECAVTSSTAYYWNRVAIDNTAEIGDLGGLNWRMVLCLVAAWTIVYLCVMKGIKTSGKVGGKVVQNRFTSTVVHK